MALKDIFNMIKADRYTADGREELIKAQEAETEDKVYQIGEISEKTGLQKTAQGWKPPKETKFGKVKQNKEGQWGVQTKQGKGSDFLKHKSEKEASRALANYTAGYNTTERSKQDPHSDYARQQKQWNKEVDRMRKNSNAERRAEHASHFQENKPDQLDETTGYENKSLFELQDIYNSNEGKKLEGSVKEQHEKIAKELQKRITNEPTKNKGFKKGDRVFNRYGETANVLATAGDFVLVENRGRKEWQSENAYQGKVATDSAPRVLTGDCRIRIRKEKPALTGDTKIRVRK